MVTDSKLICALLRKLAEIEKMAADGRPVQPAMDRSVADPIVIDGYDWSAIDEHLKKLIEYGLVDATEIMVGIHFKRLTDAGHRVLADCNPVHAT
jgi:DNA-binding transcriptional ArsR family regulator